MSETVIGAARQRSTSTTIPALRATHEHAALLHAVVLLHEIASSSSSSSELAALSRAIRRAGRRLEDALDGERARPAALLVSRTIEPDIVPLADGVAVVLATANQPGGDPVVAEIAEALAVVVEGDLGPALASCGLPSFELPRPWRTTFQPQRHQLLERGEGPRDVVIAVERCGRIGRAGRLLEPALVIVGGAA